MVDFTKGPVINFDTEVIIGVNHINKLIKKYDKVTNYYGCDLKGEKLLELFQAYNPVSRTNNNLIKVYSDISKKVYHVPDLSFVTAKNRDANKSINKELKEFFKKQKENIILLENFINVLDSILEKFREEKKQWKKKIKEKDATMKQLQNIIDKDKADREKPDKEKGDKEKTDKEKINKENK